MVHLVKTLRRGRQRIGKNLSNIRVAAYLSGGVCACC